MNLKKASYSEDIILSDNKSSHYVFKEKLWVWKLDFLNLLTFLVTSQFFWEKVYFLSAFLLAILLLCDNFYSALQDSIYPIHKSNALNIPEFPYIYAFLEKSPFRPQQNCKAPQAFFEGFKVSKGIYMFPIY